MCEWEPMGWMAASRGGCGDGWLGMGERQDAWVRVTSKMAAGGWWLAVAAGRPGVGCGDGWCNKIGLWVVRVM